MQRNTVIQKKIPLYPFSSFPKSSEEIVDTFAIGTGKYGHI